MLGEHDGGGGLRQASQICLMLPSREAASQQSQVSTFRLGVEIEDGAAPDQNSGRRASVPFSIAMISRFKNGIVR